MSGEAFFASTPYLTGLQTAAAHKAMVRLAWHTIAFDRTERLPALSTLLADQDEPAVMADAAEMRAWLGGHPTLQ